MRPLLGAATFAYSLEDQKCHEAFVGTAMSLEEIVTTFFAGRCEA